MSICGGVAGARGSNPSKIFMHNDGGSQNANAAFYRTWLSSHPLENGFAHYYVADDGTLQAEDDWNMAWHCGDDDGNENGLSIEVCQSLGDTTTFLQNEEKSLQLAAQKCMEYGIVPSASTIMLHREVYETSCPHRSVELHGGATGCKNYFIQRITELINPIGLGAPVFKKQKDTLDIGFNFRLKTPEGRFKWLMYDIGKNQWITLNNWTASNWISIAVPKAAYLIQCQLYDLQSNHVETKTIGTDGASATEITGTYMAWETPDTVLFGANSNNPDVTYVFKLYDKKTQKWFTQFNGQWARFKPEKGTAYIVQAEAYNKSDKRLLASKAMGLQA